MNIKDLCIRIKQIIPGLLLLGVMLVSMATYAAAPVVSGVSGHQRAGTKLVDINYTVSDADGD